MTDMVDHLHLEGMDAQQLRGLAAELMTRVAAQEREIVLKQARIDQLTHEMALLKRWKFGRRSEQLDAEQKVRIQVGPRKATTGGDGNCVARTR